MKDILESLAHVVERAIMGFANRHSGCRFALGCNVDYGNVCVAVDPSPPRVPADAFFSGNAEELYAFGDWPIPDLVWEDPTFETLWKEHWSRHEDVIRDDWRDLPGFEHAFRKKLLLQGICRIAADLSARLPGIVPPILVADHDEHIRHTTARLEWAFRGPPTSSHALLASGCWLRKEEKLTHHLGFFHDREFINHVVPFNDPGLTVEAEGDWGLSDDRLVMTMTATNWKRADVMLWKTLPYKVLSLDTGTLKYREEDDTIWEYQQTMTKTVTEDHRR